MKKALAVLMTSLLVLMQFGSVSLAESKSWDGKVVSIEPQKIASPFQGIVEESFFAPGDSVKKDEPMMTFETTKVYAGQDGTVYTYGEAGDNVEMLIQRHGAPLYLEPSYSFTISTSTKTGNGQEQNKRIIPGETVYLRGASTTSHTGVGMVSQVTDMNYTVEVTEGNLETSESVNIYRDSTYAASGRIGKGFASRVYPLAYLGLGTGHIVKFHVSSGDQVHRGDLLFETIDGSVSPVSSCQNGVSVSENGTIVSLNAGKGDNVLPGDPLATFYPDSALRIEMPIAEDELSSFKVGQHVLISLPGSDETLQGTVEKISLVPMPSDMEGQSSSCYEGNYAVYILPETIDSLFYDMNVTITAVQ